ncbi:13550_t:CDS:2 [Entrophospora sp. SA101]|nr:13550_t:CDS:2 [Entrophospora sp. SA101]
MRLSGNSSNNEDEQANIKFESEEHVAAANLERQHYNNIIDKSKNDPTITHICYDWAQSVGAPYSPQQVGAIYFKSPFIIHLFGICKTDNGENHQLNFTIGEDEMPEGISKKGANTTLNMTCPNFVFGSDNPLVLDLEAGD